MHAPIHWLIARVSLSNWRFVCVCACVRLLLLLHHQGTSCFPVATKWTLTDRQTYVPHTLFRIGAARVNRRNECSYVVTASLRVLYVVGLREGISIASHINLFRVELAIVIAKIIRIVKHLWRMDTARTPNRVHLGRRDWRFKLVQENFMFADVKIFYFYSSLWYRHVAGFRRAHCCFHGSWNQ